jgi:acetate kinase
VSSILVINSGSSSLKYQLIDMATHTPVTAGLIERVTDHGAAFAEMLERIEEVGPDALAELSGVGHRVVHGGTLFAAPVVVTDEIIRQIDSLAPLAPLHNPGNVAGIVAARQAFAQVPHVAVFDTAFHQTLPAAAHTYALDADLAAEHGVRRYGFHGTSHQFVSRQAAEFLGRPLSQLKIIVLHLGNGASACAIDGGRSVDTSMGLTPLEGLVMGTRSGDIDPAIIFYLQRVAHLGPDDVDALLNRRSGLLGLAGSGDMRDVESAAASGDASAQLALEVYAHRLRHYIGAYIAVLGGLDALVFTAGVGENSVGTRTRAVAGLAHLGIELDAERNAVRSGEPRRISPDDAAVSVLVVPTNEELEIARSAAELL